MCGNFGAHSSMVIQTTSIKTPTGTIKLKQNLTCDNYGIYVACCTVCSMFMSAKPKINFQHAGIYTDIYGKKNLSTDNDNSALVQHYYKYHIEKSNILPVLSDCYFHSFIHLFLFAIKKLRAF